MKIFLLLEKVKSLLNSSFRLLQLLFFISFYSSCQLENPPIREDSPFNVNLEISSLKVFPNDSISISFGINCSDGVAPFSFIWVNPDTLLGEGPFIISLDSNLILDLEVFDAEQAKVEFHYELLKDTIDFERYDYRNEYYGFYQCDVIYRSATEETPGVFITKETLYRDTIEVSESSDITMLEISDFTEVNYNFTSSSFDAYHLSGKFRSDSIFFYYYETPVGLRNWTYKGSKIN
jgi:hypothetical protein